MRVCVCTRCVWVGVSVRVGDCQLMETSKREKEGVCWWKREHVRGRESVCVAARGRKALYSSGIKQQRERGKNSNRRYVWMKKSKMKILEFSSVEIVDEMSVVKKNSLKIWQSIQVWRDSFLYPGILGKIKSNVVWSFTQNRWKHWHRYLNQCNT